MWPAQQEFVPWQTRHGAAERRPTPIMAAESLELKLPNVAPHPAAPPLQHSIRRHLAPSVLRAWARPYGVVLERPLFRSA